MTAFDPVEFTRALVRRPSVTPEDAGALDLVEGALKALGFATHRLVFSAEGEASIDNLYARRGEASPNFCFAGHTDVVPVGDPRAWTYPPFDAALEAGVLWGRGAADMKGAIAAFIAAADRLIADGGAKGSISLLITGDEEGPAVNGTKKVLSWMAERGERIDHCVVGEPSGNETLGDLIKVGRRGSMNCWLTVRGRQGHVAYPDRARNPIPALLKKLLALSETPLDAGFEAFQPSSLQVTDIHVGNAASNVIPASATARFNIRFNPNWTGATLEQWLRAKLDEIAAIARVDYELKAICSGDAFLTRDEDFLAILGDAIEAGCGQRPQHSTTGGTSDARFIKDAAPVAEFGLVGSTIHQIDEHVRAEDILTLADIYADVMRRYFHHYGAR